MKKLISLIVCGMCCLGAWAQGSIPLLDKVQGHRVTFHYTYSLAKNGADFSPVTDGDVTLEGNAYILEGLGLEVVSNGSTRWSVDREAKELVIETVEKEDLFTNPALFVGAYRDYMDKMHVNASGDAYLDVTLTLDTDTRARFLLTDIVYMDPKGKSDFSLDEKSLSGDYVVTDLR